METHPVEKVQYRRAGQEDLYAIALIFLESFPESVRHYAGRMVSPKVMVDVFAVCLDAESSAFYVAVVDGQLAGYIFAPARFSRVVRTALIKGHLVRMFWRWITGQYGIGLEPVSVAARNWLYLWKESREGGFGTDSRILSVAVSPAFQGRGIGSNLTQLELDYLKACGESKVRLEVRPDNIPAKHIYEKLGFETVGQTRDTQGDWLIMVKDLSSDAKS